jgi:hypothetical protein
MASMHCTVTALHLHCTTPSLHYSFTEPPPTSLHVTHTLSFRVAATGGVTAAAAQDCRGGVDGTQGKIRGSSSSEHGAQVSWISLGPVHSEFEQSNTRTRFVRKLIH